MKKLLMVILALQVAVSAQTSIVEADRLKTTDPEAAARLFRQAIDADISAVRAHEGYIWSMKRWRMGPEPPEAPPAANAPKNRKGVPIYFAPKTRATPVGGGAASAELKATYEGWIAAHPNVAVLHWGLGFSTITLDRAAAEASIRRAIDLDPKLSIAYRSMALLAQLNRDNDGRAAWLKRAVDANPLDDDSVLEYVDTIPEAERAAHLWRVADRSAGTMSAYSALLKLSSLASTPEAKLPIYAKLWTTFPEMKTYSHCWTMKAYFNLTTDRDPATALAVATRFDDVCVGDPDWPEFLARQQQRQAVSPDAAYADTLAKAAKAPSESLITTLNSLGASLGKTPAQVDDELWARVSASAKPFKDFTLTRFDNGKKLTLSSLRGKVVLVNFWFPTCGPCLNEFPYIQQALEKYQSRGFEILAINIVSSEDGQVLQTAKDKKVGFTMLKMPDDGFAAREYRVAGAPTNFLLDAAGRVLFQPQIHDRETARNFELAIEMLLKRGR